MIEKREVLTLHVNLLYMYKYLSQVPRVLKLLKWLKTVYFNMLFYEGVFDKVLSYFIKIW